MTFLLVSDQFTQDEIIKFQDNCFNNYFNNYDYYFPVLDRSIHRIY